MIRFACPRCNAILGQPENVAGTTIACPSCGQWLQVPALPEEKALADNDRTAPAESQPAPLPPPPFVTARPNPPSAPATPPALPPAPKRRRRRDADYDDDYDDDFPSIERPSPRRGRYSQEASAKAASSGLVCSLISLGLLVLTFLLWVLSFNQQGRFAGEGEPLVAVALLVILGSFVLALLGTVFSSRGLDESNRYNRGQATAGLVCGIIAMVIGAVVGLFFLCIGMVFWSAVRW